MIYIVTVYDSLNYGSFFQAYAMSNELKQYDDVSFIDIHHQSTFKQTVNTCIKKIIKLRFKDAMLNYDKYLQFKKARQYFDVVDIKDIDNNIVIFGSDEIWNISRKKIYASKEFFGKNIKAKRKIAMAISINNASLDQFKKDRQLVELLKEFDLIALRDSYSKEVIEKIVDRDCLKVMDPTILMDVKQYDEFAEAINEDNYILVYTYGKMLNKRVIADIKDFADKKNLKIISVGRYFDFCDKNLSVNPKQFLSYIKNAEYVFTDTFHGTMFSLIYNKNFIAFDCNNTKVEEVLKDFDILNRLKKYDDSIDDILKDDIDYELINKKINIEKEKLRKLISENIR